jgi:hypothetical protein
MNIGMLWFDNDPKPGLARKVRRAAIYYRAKYGLAPTLCYVHPSMLANPLALADLSPSPSADSPVYNADGVEIRSNRSVLPNHLWIGVHRSEEEPATRS